MLQHALQLDLAGELSAATRAYLEVLKRDPTHFSALNELGRLAQDSGHLAAARSAYQQAVYHHPSNAIGRVNLGNLLYESGELDAARLHYEAALRASPDMAEAHQGVARVLAQLGQETAAALHRQKGFAAQPVALRRYRGRTPPAAVLLLVSARGGNIPTRQILDTRIFATTVLYTEFFPPTRPLPPHALVFNAIGDADLCATALSRAELLLRQTTAPIINSPTCVSQTARAANAARLAGISGLVVPEVRSLARATLAQWRRSPLQRSLRFPLLLRSPGFHTGRHFLRIERAEDLAAAAAQLPGDELLLIDYLDARGSDGMARKYRVMCIDGVLYPLHLAISSDWKVHYFSSAMGASAAFRSEEQQFLQNMSGVLGAQGLRALSEVGRRLALDYAGFDFAIGRDGSLLLFEANATMVINPPDPEPIWDYRRPAINRALEAARHMLLARAASQPRQA